MLFHRLQIHEIVIKCNVRRLQTLLFYPSGDLRKSPTTCGKPTEVSGRLPQFAGNLRRSTEVLCNLQESSGERRKSRATLRETNCNCRKSPAACRKQNAIAGSLLQLAGNQMQFSMCYLEIVMVSLFFFCWMCTVLPSPKPSASSHFPLSRISGTVMR